MVVETLFVGGFMVLFPLVVMEGLALGFMDDAIAMVGEKVIIHGGRHSCRWRLYGGISMRRRERPCA
jgi:hypothetical protein